jgi:N-acetylmuramoyl-L-alanine amidase
LLKSKVVLILFCFIPSLLFSPQSRAESSPSRTQDSETVAIPEAARHFGATTSWKPAEGRLSLAYQDHRAEILIGTNRLMVDDYLVVLTSPVEADNGTVSMLLSDAATMFSRLLGRAVTPGEIASAGLLSHGLAGNGDIILIQNIRYISYPRFTRLVVNVSDGPGVQEAEINCIEDQYRLKIEIPRSRFAQIKEPFEVGDRVVKSVELVQTPTGATLVVNTLVDEIEYEIQKHDDPPRMVIDVRPARPTIVTDYHDASALTPAEKWDDSARLSPSRRSSLTTIVIDPGHGGKDFGAQGRGGLLEKDVTLDIAMKLKEIIEAGANINVVLTRSGDYFVSLKERTAIANRAKDGSPADLFISVHTNSHKSGRIGGFEAYYISDAADPGAEATEALENAVVELELEGIDTKDPALMPILWDLQFTEFISESSELAFLAQEELAKRLNTRNRGVRQAKFIVLSGVAMPSILVEVGFISNRIEEAKLRTADFKDACAEALAAAVAAFKERFDTRLGLLERTPNP